MNNYRLKDKKVRLKNKKFTRAVPVLLARADQIEKTCLCHQRNDGWEVQPIAALREEQVEILHHLERIRKQENISPKKFRIMCERCISYAVANPLDEETGKLKNCCFRSDNMVKTPACAR